MGTLHRYRSCVLTLAASAALLTGACATEGEKSPVKKAAALDDTTGSGRAHFGGQSSSGGSTGGGGGLDVDAGTTSGGTSQAGSGGAQTAGGVSGAGGTSSAGGAAGGSSATGGTSSAGGAAGGSSATGGTTAHGGTDTGGTTAQGGAAGAAGQVAGTAGWVADAGTGGMAGYGTAGNCGESGAGGGLQTCPGCAVMSMPFNGSGQKAGYRLDFSTLVDVSSASLILRIYAPGATAGDFQAFVQQGTSPWEMCTVGWQSPTLFADDWHTLTLPLSGCTSHEDIGRVGVEFLSGGSPVVAYLDSMEIVGAAPAVDAWDFDTADTISQTAGEPKLWPAWSENVSASLSWLGE